MMISYSSKVHAHSNLFGGKPFEFVAVAAREMSTSHAGSVTVLACSGKFELLFPPKWFLCAHPVLCFNKSENDYFANDVRKVVEVLL